jgi:hypothetical protein
VIVVSVARMPAILRDCVRHFGCSIEAAHLDRRSDLVRIGARRHPPPETVRSRS